MKVKEVMHKGVDWVGPDTPITEIAKLMSQHDVGSIPIGEDDKLVGMVTDRDIVLKVVARGKDPQQTRVGSLAEGTEVVTIGADDSLDEARRTMERHQVRRLPVIDGHRDTNQTACPGERLYDRLPAVRRRAAALVARR